VKTARSVAQTSTIATNGRVTSAVTTTRTIPSSNGERSAEMTAGFVITGGRTMSHHTDNAKGSHGEYRCPKCGEKFGNLPAHLPKCDGDLMERKDA